MKLAIFDIDGTLIHGSSERLFWRYLAARGRLGPRQVLPALGAQALRAHCARFLTGYKRPVRVEFRDALPKNPLGKILRRRLRDELTGADG